MNPEWRNKTTYGLVLTEGPCGGKTTGQARLGTFFEGLGWKVYRVPETAAILLGGGVKLPDLTEEQAYRFQENLLKTMLQIEDTYHALASASSGNCLIIYDRGAMDAIAYMKPEHWERMKMENNWNEVELRDSRYHQVIHMVSAAKGAEDFYHMDSRVSCHEGIELARQLDDLTSQAWVGHPYYDVVDNSMGFEHKVVLMIKAVCSRLGIDTGDRLSPDIKKRKFLVARLPNDDELLNREVIATNGMLDEAGIALANSYQRLPDFVVVHDYLAMPNQMMQACVRRLGRLGQNDDWMYMHKTRRPEINAEAVELKQQISRREYDLLLAKKDESHFSIRKKQQCFLWNSQDFQLDIYQEPCHPRCQGLMILKTYTTLQGDDLKLPSFLEITREVTDDRHFSMHYLSAKDTQLEVNGTSNGDSHVTELQVKPIPGKVVTGVNHNDIDGLEYVE